jgi:hypothetical protein
MEDKLTRRNSGRFFVGLVLLVVGSLYLLQNFGFIEVDHISHYWPVLLILFGLVRLINYDGISVRHTGIGWIFLGLWFLISMNGWFGLDFHNAWPILIIGWGIAILWKTLYRQPKILMTEEQHHGN